MKDTSVQRDAPTYIAAIHFLPPKSGQNLSHCGDYSGVPLSREGILFVYNNDVTTLMSLPHWTNEEGASHPHKLM